MQTAVPALRYAPISWMLRARAAGPSGDGHSPAQSLFDLRSVFGCFRQFHMPPAAGQDPA